MYLAILSVIGGTYLGIKVQMNIDYIFHILKSAATSMTLVFNVIIPQL